MADALEEQVGARLVDRKVSELVQDENRRLEVLVQLGLKPSGRLRGGAGNSRASTSGGECFGKRRVLSVANKTTISVG
jgi:hypothetical protein